jgi:cell division protein FtsB
MSAVPAIAWSPTVRPEPAEPAAVAPLRLVPAAAQVSLTPFLAVIGLLLVIGLAGLLVVNTALARNSFAVTELRSEVARLEVQRTELAAELARLESPDELARRAQQLGMVPGEVPQALIPRTAPQ